MDYKEAAKKYWPYLLGGAVGLYFLMRGGGGGATDSTSAFYAAQAQGAAASNASALQNKQLDIAATQAAAQIQLQRDTIQAQREVANIQAASQMAGAVGTSTAQVLAALYAPGITAMQAAALENQSALTIAGQVAIGGFQTQAQMLQSGTNAVGHAASAFGQWGGVLEGLGSILTLDVPQEQAIDPQGVLGYQKGSIF